MRKRSRSREFALQVLYQLDIVKEGPERALEQFWSTNETSPEEEVRLFTEQLVCGACEHRASIDAKIAESAANWQLERMAVVERNILRLGCFELLFRQDIPPKVAINEAVELAKRFSGEEAGKFVNGILDSIRISSQT